MLMSSSLIYRAALVHFGLNPLITLAAVSTRSCTAAATTQHYVHTSAIQFHRSTPSLLNSQCSSTHQFAFALPSCTKKNMSTANTSTPKPPEADPSKPTEIPPTPPRPESQDEGEQQQEEKEEGNPKPLLALPPTASDDAKHILDASGNSGSGSSTLKLDHLGPMVVNQDGTLSRIANWAQMTEIEKRNTLRVLGKRNQERMAALKEGQASKKAEEEKV